MEQTIMAFFAVAGGISWIFKVWIINPLSTTMDNNNRQANEAIGRLVNSIAKLEGVLEQIQRQNVEIMKTLATNEASLKSAHKRLDDLGERLRDCELKCSNCPCKE